MDFTEFLVAVEYPGAIATVGIAGAVAYVIGKLLDFIQGL